MKRLNSRATAAITDSGIPTFQKPYWQVYWRWAASLFNILNFDPKRVTAHVLRLRDLASLQAYAANDPRGRQGHVGCVRVWRWETAIFDFFNAKKLLWYNVVKDKSVWAEYFDKFWDLQRASRRG